MRYVELRRHTDNDGDALTADGVAAAEAIGRDRLHPPYAAFVSTGAARASRMRSTSSFNTTLLPPPPAPLLMMLLAVTPSAR